MKVLLIGFIRMLNISTGKTSPPGFAAVVLLDESHFTAHCYSQKGWLSIDCFTCGATDTNSIVEAMDLALKQLSPSIHLQMKKSEKKVHQWMMML